MSLTPATLAFDIIRRAGDRVQRCQYEPRGQQADAAARFLGRKLGFETFISEKQAELFARLLGESTVITAGEGKDRFAAFVKTVFSRAKNKDFYLLVFGGFVPPAVEEKEEVNEDERWHPADDMPASAPVATPVQATSSNRANGFAAKLIVGAIEKGRAQKDSFARAGEDDYLITWLSAAQADALARLLPPGTVKQDGSFLTQACGCFCYWGKKRTQSGAQLLCWMGEPAEVEAQDAPPPAPTAPVNGKRIPMDVDIPF